MFWKPKIDASCPDHWAIKVNYLNGSTAEYKVVYQTAIINGLIEIVTTDDIRVMISMTNVLSLEYDKAYTRIVEKQMEGKKKHG